MDSESQIVERLIKAVSPALSEELGRVLVEVRREEEAEARKRLEAAVGEAEEAVRKQALAEQEAVVTSMQTDQRKAADEFQAQMARQLQEAERQHAQMQEELKKAEAVWTSERAQLQNERDQWRIFSDAQRVMAEATSQPEILMRWLQFSEPFGAAVAVYVAKADGLALWKSRGTAAFPDIVSPATTDPEFYFRTIVVRGKIVAAVTAAQPFQSEPLDFLVAAMQRAIEVFGLRLRAPAVRVTAPEAARIP